MVTAVGFILILCMVVLLIWGKISLPPIFIVLPVLGALICGFGLSDITGFVSSGLGSVLNTAALFTFSVIYFGLLSDVGMFDVIVKKVMKYMGNKVELVLVMAGIIAFISHLDGSGATTMLITIPTMLPIFKAMKMRPVSLLYMAIAVSGIMNVMPWCSSVLRICSSTGMDPQELWLSVLPLQVIGLVLIFLSVIPIARIERKNGAGMSNEEFAEMKKSLDTPAELKVSKGVIAFDMILTLALIAAMLFGLINSNLGFMLGLGIAVVVNFPKSKDQVDGIKRHGGTALYMVMVIFSIGILVGVMDGTGMMAGMTNALLGIIPSAMGSHLPFIIALFSVPLSIIIGSDTVYLVMAPILGEIVISYGGTMLQTGAALLVGACVAAGICLIGPSPYLALGLAGVEMGESLRYNFKWVWALGIILACVAPFFGIFPF